MDPLYSSVMAEQPPRYLDGYLGYISSPSFRLSPLILNILLLSRALNSRQVLCLLAAIDTSLGRDPLVREDSPSSLSPRRPLHLYHYYITRFFYSSSFTYLLLPLDSSGVFSLPSILTIIPSSTKHPRSLFSPRRLLYLYYLSITRLLHDRRLMNSIDYRIVRLRRRRDKCLRFLKTRYPILEVAQGSQRYQEYTRVRVRLNCLLR